MPLRIGGDIPVNIQEALRELDRRLAKVETQAPGVSQDQLSEEVVRLKNAVTASKLRPTWQDPNDVFPGGMISKETIKLQSVDGGVDLQADGWDARISSAYQVLLEAGYNIRIKPGMGADGDSSGHLGAIYLDGDVGVLGTLFGRLKRLPGIPHGEWSPSADAAGTGSFVWGVETIGHPAFTRQTSNTQILINESGLYLVIANLTITGATATAQNRGDLLKNATTIASNRSTTPTNITNVNLNVSAVALMKSGDFFQASYVTGTGTRSATQTFLYIVQLV